MNRQKVFERDMCLINFIKQHKGRENAVSSKDVVKHLKDKGFEMPKSSLLPILRKIMYEWELPICFVSMGGYYYATKKSDIVPVIEDLKNRIEGMQNHIEHLEKFIIE